MASETNQQRWQRLTLGYAESVNTFVAKGLAEGWENAGEEPVDVGRDELVPDVLNAIREANLNGETEKLRKQWPPAHAPFVDLLENKSQSISKVCFLSDGSILARIGSAFQEGKIVRIIGDDVTTVKGDVFFGVCPNKRFFCYSLYDGIEIRNGWDGDRIALCPWPKGNEGIPKKWDVKVFDHPPRPTQLIPFPDGRRVLLVSSDGIYVLSTDSSKRLLPSNEELEEHFRWLQEEEPDDELSMCLSMEHGAVSHDGKFIAVGSQDSTHLIFDQNLNLVGDIGNHSEYPHFAFFSSDDSMVAFNSCHFYNGVTIGVPLNKMPGLETPPYQENDDVNVLEKQSRVYAAASRDDELIIGDASGYVRAFSNDGKAKWNFFVGSTVNDIDISSDGSTLIVSTYAGFLSIVSLDAGTQNPYQIGNSKHMEIRRWIFWKDEKQPLIW